MALPPKPHPTFNHIAMSVAADLLDEAGRAAMLDFYGQVFGWTEMPTLTADRERLVLRAYNHEQFVFLVADPEPLTAPAMDHFGMSVETVAELHGIRERALAYAKRVDDVEVTDVDVEDYGVVKLHGFYTRYRLPLRVEVQCFEWQEGVDPTQPPPDA
jgi:hypothetical protein